MQMGAGFGRAASAGHRQVMIDKALSLPQRAGPAFRLFLRAEVNHRADVVIQKPAHLFFRQLQGCVAADKAQAAAGQGAGVFG